MSDNPLGPAVQAVREFNEVTRMRMPEQLALPGISERASESANTLDTAVTQFVSTMRTLTVVEHVLCNEVNQRLVTRIETLGSGAMGLHTLASNVLFSEKLFLEEEDRKIDLGFVGRVTSVNSKLIDLLSQADTIPVIAPLGRDKTGVKDRRGPFAEAVDVPAPFNTVVSALVRAREKKLGVRN